MVNLMISEWQLIIQSWNHFMRQQLIGPCHPDRANSVSSPHVEPPAAPPSPEALQLLNSTVWPDGAQISYICLQQQLTVQTATFDLRRTHLFTRHLLCFQRNLSSSRRTPWLLQQRASASRCCAVKRDFQHPVRQRWSRCPICCLIKEPLRWFKKIK